LSSPFERDIHCLLGIPFDAIDMAGAVQRVKEAAARREPCFLSTPNVNWVVGCLEDVAFRDSVIGSHLVIADGMPLVWAAKLLGIPIRERVAGSGLFEILRHDRTGRMSVFFFGGQPGVAEAACQQLNSEAGGLHCAGFECPGFGTIEEMSSDECVAGINASGADFVVVALGAKKGQAWIERNRSSLTAPVISHLGAVIDFVAGRVSRAPAWTQRAGLEWLWRIKEAPALWRRYFFDGLVFLRLLVTRVFPYAWFMRLRRPVAHSQMPANAQLRDEAGQVVIRLSGPWVRENLRPLRDLFAAIPATTGNVTLEMSGVTYVDSAFVGLVMLLQHHHARNGVQLTMASVPTSIRRIFRYCSAEYLCRALD